MWPRPSCRLLVAVTVRTMANGSSTLSSPQYSYSSAQLRWEVEPVSQGCHTKDYLPHLAKAVKCGIADLRVAIFELRHTSVSIYHSVPPCVLGPMHLIYPAPTDAIIATQLASRNTRCSISSGLLMGVTFPSFVFLPLLFWFCC